jgi:hypothetical protein
MGSFPKGKLKSPISFFFTHFLLEVDLGKIIDKFLYECFFKEPRLYASANEIIRCRLGLGIDDGRKNGGFEGWNQRHNQH